AKPMSAENFAEHVSRHGLVFNPKEMTAQL
ncbi:MAG: hypothetical protein ACI9W0_003378, partial [Gammaproteobacteria bacterium]